MVVKLQSQLVVQAAAAAGDIAKVVAREAEASAATELSVKGVAESARELPMVGFFLSPVAGQTKESPRKVTAREAASCTLKALKALTELIAEDQVCQIQVKSEATFERF